MKTLSLYLSILIVTLSSFSLAHAQTYSDTLETVLLNSTKEETVLENTFESYHNELIALANIKFRKEILKAKEEGHELIFVTNQRAITIPKTNYLKTLRKGANRSEDVKSFRLFLQERLPALRRHIKNDPSIVPLYEVSRKATFNGRLDAIPIVF